MPFYGQIKKKDVDLMAKNFWHIEFEGGGRKKREHFK